MSSPGGAHRLWGWLLLVAAALFILRYAVRVPDELRQDEPKEAWGILELAPAGSAPPDDVGSGRPVELVDGGDALLLQRTGVSARLWSAERGEWVWFTDDMSRRFRVKPRQQPIKVLPP